MPASDAILSSLALIRTFFSHDLDYLEAFLPLALDCIRSDSDGLISLPGLTEALEKTYGLALPQGVVQQLLKRASRQGYLKKTHGIWRRNDEKLKELGFSARRAQVVRQHKDLILDLCSFATQFDKEWSEEEAEEVLYRFLRKSDLVRVGGVKYGAGAPSVEYSAKGPEFVIGRYIESLRMSRSERLQHLDEIAQGSILAGALFLPNPGGVKKKFRGTAIYLDTKLLLRLLGHSGEALQRPAEELLNLAVQLDLKVRCFDHTRDECYGILMKTSESLKYRDMPDRRYETLEYFLQAGATSGHVFHHAQRLEKDLAAREIELVEGKDQQSPHVADVYSELRAELYGGINYATTAACDRDASSLAAVYGERGRKKHHSYETCRALLVTTNVEIARIAGRYAKRTLTTGSIPLVITDTFLTSLLWLKEPNQAPDLTRQQIVATCFAAIAPSSEFWSRFNQELEGLREIDDLDDSEYYMLRSTQTATRMLMDVTLGEDSAFTEGTIADLREKLRERIRDEERRSLEVELDKKSAASQRALSELREASLESENLQKEYERRSEREIVLRESQEKRIRERVERGAFGVRKAVEILLVVAVIACGVLLHFSDVIGGRAPLVRNTVLGGSLIVAILSALNLVLGFFLQKPLIRFEKWLGSRVVHSLLADVSREQGQSDEAGVGPSEL